jgi:hypothetical protein
LPTLIIGLKNDHDHDRGNIIQKIYQITLIFALINILSIIMCLILISNKIIKIQKKKANFIKMNTNLEKIEISSRNIHNKNNMKTPQSNSDCNSKDFRHNKKMITLKIKDNIIDNQNSGRNINNYYAEKMTSNRYDASSKKDEDSKIGKRGSLNLFAKSKNSETGKENIQPMDLKFSHNLKNQINNSVVPDNKNINKKNKYIFAYTIIEIADTLNLIWTLIILYIEYNGKCLHISFVYSCLRLSGEIISFPINSVIIKYLSNYTQFQLKNLSKQIMIMNIIFFLGTIIANIIMFLYYFFFTNIIILLLLFSSILIRKIFSIINIQLFKIYSTKDFNIQSNNMTLLNKNKQYTGTFAKSIIFLIGSYGYYLIYNISFNLNQISNTNIIKFSKIIFIIYFIIIPAIINIILIIGTKFFFSS